MRRAGGVEQRLLDLEADSREALVDDFELRAEQTVDRRPPIEGFERAEVRGGPRVRRQ